MKRILLISLIGSLIPFIGCKKDSSDPIDPVVPVFSIAGNINGNYVSIQAGVDDYYMYSSCKVDSVQLHSFEGTFKKANCTNCTNQFSIKLNDRNPGISVSSSHLDSLLNEGLHYHHDSAKNTSYCMFKSQPDAGLTPQSYYWDFGDGTISNQKDPHHVFYGNGSYTVCHTITYNTGTSNESCNEVKADFYDCYAFIDYHFNNDTCFFNGNATGNSITDPVRFEWNFGDPASVKDTSYQQNPYYIYGPGAYTVTMKTTDPEGCNYTITRTIKRPKEDGVRTAYYTYSKLLTPLVDYSVVTITWTDENGSVYSTGNVKQPVDSYFQITSVEDYEPNENAEPTKKINARIKCKLSNGSKSISMDDVKVIFAVSYK